MASGSGRAIVSTVRGRLRAALVVGLALVLVQCESGTQPPPGAAGVVTYRLVSPNGAEGGLLASIPGGDVIEVGPGSGLTEVIARSVDGTVYVAVVHRFGTEELTFDLHVVNTSAPPAPTLVEVVSPGNGQRSLAGYTLEIVP